MMYVLSKLALLLVLCVVCLLLFSCDVHAALSVEDSATLYSNFTLVSNATFTELCFENDANTTVQTGSNSTCHHAVQLTESKAESKGAVWYKIDLPVSYGFETSFKFRIDEPSLSCPYDYGDVRYCQTRGGHGLAFVIRGDPAIPVKGAQATATATPTATATATATPTAAPPTPTAAAPTAAGANSTSAPTSPPTSAPTAAADNSTQQTTTAQGFTQDADIGEGGSGLGYANLYNTLALEFDTWYNDELGDLFDNHIGLQTRGHDKPNSAHHRYSFGTSSTINDLELGVHEVKVVYSPMFDSSVIHPSNCVNIRACDKLQSQTNFGTMLAAGYFPKGVGTMTVYVDDFTAPKFIAPMMIDTALNLMNGGSTATLGFTAATGTNTWQIHNVFDWSVCSVLPNATDTCTQLL